MPLLNPKQKDLARTAAIISAWGGGESLDEYIGVYFGTDELYLRNTELHQHFKPYMGWVSNVLFMHAINLQNKSHLSN